MVMNKDLKKKTHLIPYYLLLHFIPYNLLLQYCYSLDPLQREVDVVHVHPALERGHGLRRIKQPRGGVGEGPVVGGLDEGVVDVVARLDGGRRGGQRDQVRPAAAHHQSQVARHRLLVARLRLLVARLKLQVACEIPPAVPT